MVLITTLCLPWLGQIHRLRDAFKSSKIHMTWESFSSSPHAHFDELTKNHGLL